MTSDTILHDSTAGLAAVRREIAEACATAGRAPEGVTLVAVSKTFAAEAIVPVIAAGQRVFGENRVQEAMAKWPPLRESRPGLELAPDRTAAIEQGAGGGRPVRRHPFDRPAERLPRGGEGDRAPGPSSHPVRRDQHRRRAAEGRRAAGERRCLHRELPQRIRPRDLRADVHPAPRRGAGACTSRLPRRSRHATASRSCPWA